MKRMNELFFNTFDPVINLSAGGSIERTIVLSADSDFVLSDIFGQAFPTGTLANPVLFKLNLNDGAINKDFANAPVLSSLICVNANVINPLPVYRLLKGQSTITAKLTNITAAAVDIYISLRGYKIPRDSAAMVNLSK